MKILDKDPTKKAENAEIVTDPGAILDDDSIGMVVALCGGHDFNTEGSKSSKKGKHVVTANKAVIGAHFEELCDRRKRTASCCAMKLR